MGSSAYLCVAVGHVEPGQRHACVEQRNDGVDLRGRGSTNKRSVKGKCLPECAADLSLALHEVNFLEDLVFAVSAEVVVFLVLVVVDLRRVTLIVEA